MWSSHSHFCFGDMNSYSRIWKVEDHEVPHKCNYQINQTTDTMKYIEVYEIPNKSASQINQTTDTMKYIEVYEMPNKSASQIKQTIDTMKHIEVYEMPNISASQINQTIDPLEHKFILQCNTKLLSDEIIQDSLISQKEFALFLKEFSISIGNPRSYTSYYELNVPLQLDFVWAICPTSLGNDEKRLCLHSLLLNNVKNEFGLTVSDDRIETVKQTIEDLCANSWSHYS